MSSEDFNKKNNPIKLMKSGMRTYLPKDERQRNLELSQIEVKNIHFFSRRDNLWDETTHLAPSIAKYSADNVSPSSFKK